jgi:predicted enzyme related to lactoylglutathione lyase
MKNIVNWFEIYTSDIERAKRFYTAVFDVEWKEIPVDNERHAQMKYLVFTGRDDNPGSSGALVQLDVAKPGIGGTLVYFYSDNVDKELKRVETAGGKIIRPKQQVGDLGYIALIEDTEGNMIGLRSMR